MLLSILVFASIILGAVFVYLYYISPRINPLNKAENFLAMDLVDEAMREYGKILDRNPANFLVHFKMAEIFFRRNEIDQGVVHLEKILQINKFSNEVSKAEVFRRLGKAYLMRKDIEKAFGMYFEILKIYPTDQEALYHVSFIALGSEYYDVAYRHFSRLAGQSDKNFEVLFGAGMAAYQNHKTDEAAGYFREALNVQPHSEIGNLAMAFALYRKKDFRTAINYMKMIVDNSKDEDALFVAQRLLGFLYLQGRKNQEGVKVFEELLRDARGRNADDEVVPLLYDLGFACLMAEQTDHAYEYWNELYQMDRGYKNVQLLTTLLRKEMDATGKGQRRESVTDYFDDWINNAFPQDFLWNICGLKREKPLDLKRTIASAKVTAKGEGGGLASRDVDDSDIYERLDSFFNLDVESFRIVSNRVVSKLGYNVDEILQTYRENDGVDFMARSMEDKSQRALVWVRRWKGVQVGEIPLRNFAQAINDIKANLGLFITASDLTPAGEAASSRLSKVTVIFPEKLAELLANLL
ncbi:MAG: restriction endonuclease [Spirochaetes bacterium]|nr:restriction endonuclease [Spirochaetota bacterium]